VPIEIGVNETFSQRHGREVPDQADELAPHPRPLGLEACEDLLQSPQSGQLVAVKGSCAQQCRPGGFPSQLAD
jgi:DNA topoisomerase VI subunit B